MLTLQERLEKLQRRFRRPRTISLRMMKLDKQREQRREKRRCSRSSHLQGSLFPPEMLCSSTQTDIELEELEELRPRTRGDCENGLRPCPWVGCRHHLYLEVSSRGSIKLNFPDLEPWEMPKDGSCSLDVADRVSRGDESLKESLQAKGELFMSRVGTFLGLSGMRVQNIIVDALEKLRGSSLKRHRYYDSDDEEGESNGSEYDAKPSSVSTNDTPSPRACSIAPVAHTA